MPKKKRPEKAPETVSPIEGELLAALALLKAALPILKPDAPLRWYKNDCVRDDIRKFLRKHGVKPQATD